MPPDLLFGVVLAPVTVLLMVGFMSETAKLNRVAAHLPAIGFLLFAVSQLADLGSSRLWPMAVVFAAFVATVGCRLVLGAGQKLVTDEKLYRGGERDQGPEQRFTTGQLLLLMAAVAGLAAACANFSIEHVAHTTLVGYSFFVTLGIGFSGGVAAAMGVWLACGQHPIWRRSVGALAVAGAASALVGGVVWIAVSADQQERLWTLPILDDLAEIRFAPWRPMVATVAASAIAAVPLRLSGRRWQDWPFD